MNKEFKIIENSENQNVDDFYKRFEEKLRLTHIFPTDYMFKYITPSDQSVIAKLYAIFVDTDASISTRETKNGKYTSVTIKVPVNDAKDVIIYYRQAASIEGIMAL